MCIIWFGSTSGAVASLKTINTCHCVYRDTVWSMLTGQAYDSTPTIVLHDVKEIETWILRLLSAPVPVPGKTRVELEVLSPTAHAPLLFALPDHTRFALVDFPLHLPLELLGKCFVLYTVLSTTRKNTNRLMILCFNLSRSHVINLNWVKVMLYLQVTSYPRTLTCTLMGYRYIYQFNYM